MTLTIDQAIRQAGEAQKSGHLKLAEKLYLTILEAQPSHPEANHQLGVLALSSGKLSKAISFFKVALEALPSQPKIWVSYIDALTRMGDQSQASVLLAAAKKNGFTGDEFENLAKRLVIQKNETVDAKRVNAKSSYSERRKLELAQKRAKKQKAIAAPHSFANVPSQAQINEALTLFNAGSFSEAEVFLEDLKRRFPDHPFAWKVLGVILNFTGRKEGALDYMLKAAKLSPEDAAIHSNLGLMCAELGRSEEAETHCLKAIHVNPHHAEAHNNLGNTLRNLGRIEEAEASYREAIRIAPQYAEAHCNLGNALRDRGWLDEAEACNREAIRISPSLAEAHSNLGAIYLELGNLEQSELSCREAIRLKPDHAEAHCNLANTLREFGRPEESETSYRTAIQIKPDYIEARSNLLFHLSGLKKSDPSEYLKQAEECGRLIERAATARFTQWHLDPNPETLRVGVLSGDLHNHPVGYFLEGICKNIDPNRLELLAFSTTPVEDELTARIKPFFREWHPLYGANDEAASQKIHDAKVNILIDLSGHTAGNRLGVFAYKPAPVQVSWLGYWATTGLKSMDFLLGDPYVTPEGEDHLYTESVWRLPETRYCFTTPSTEHSIEPWPYLRNGFVTFGCFNHLSKMTDSVVALWSKILLLEPTTKLFLKSKQLSETSIIKEVKANFAKHGVTGDRIILEGQSPRDEYLETYNRIDIALDPFPYSGGTTTAEALWMGVPVITKRGHSLLSRQTESILQNSGLADWVAENQDDYVAKALYWVNNANALPEKSNFRTQALSSPMFDPLRFARYFEEALWGMWKKANP